MTEGNNNAEVSCMRSKIVSILETSEGYISGERLSKELGITRSAVWKHIKELKENGYEIESVHGMGYRLKSAPDLLNAERITAGLGVSLVGRTVVTLKTVDSTNEEIKRLAREGAQEGLVVASEEQTAGKGRFGRLWSSGNDGGLYFSFLLKPELPPADLASITLAVGYAVCLAVRECTGLDARIKWPNDIIIGNKKLCGILTEMAAQSDRIDYVIPGIGINVNNREFPEHISSKATSIYMETGEMTDRSEFLRELLKKLDTVISGFLISLSIDDIEHFKTICATIGRTVSVIRSGQEIKGVARDITAAGELVIMTSEGHELIISSGEVTVQGIY